MKTDTESPLESATLKPEGSLGAACSPSLEERYEVADRCLCQLQGMLDAVDPDDTLGDHIIERLWNYLARHDQAALDERLCSKEEMIAWADFNQYPENVLFASPGVRISRAVFEGL